MHDTHKPVTRRSFLRALGAGVAAATLPRASLAAAGDRPNIIFIYADDHAQQAISAYGSRLNQTPHIDRLAAEGVRFSESFVANSICGPARATILTGLHSHVNGKMTNGKGFKDDLPTYAKLMQKAGYQTAMVGKWHIAPKPNGFDYWAIAKGGYYNTDLQTAAGVKRQTGYTTDIITDDALAWIEGKRDKQKPFIAWISHTASHRTWAPGPKHLTDYDGQTIPEPSTLFDDHQGRSKGAAAAQMRVARDLFPAYDLKLPVTGKGILDRAATGKLKRMTPEQRKAWHAAYGPKNAAFAKADPQGKDLVKWKYQRYIKDYLRCVAALDDSVGKVLHALERTGLDRNTIVIYSSDQGFFLGEHGWYDKRWIYEPSLRTPLIVRWPGVASKNTVCDRMVQNIDMAPTFLEMAGIAPPASMQGRSLAPLLRGETPDSWRDAVYYHYHQKDSGRTAHTVARHYGVRTERHKLVYVYDHDAWELYDLQSDPDEMHNLYADPKHADTVKALKQRLAALRKTYKDDTGKAMT
ncbi:sulfatase [bacterium]|nr:sulfatase [bacterium]